MEIVTRTQDLFDYFQNTNSEINWLTDEARREFYLEVLMFVGSVLHQNFDMPPRSEFHEMVSQCVFETFDEAHYLEVIPHELICDVVEELFYRIAPYVVDIRTSGKAVTGVSCSRMIGLDAVIFLELSNFRTRDLKTFTV